MRKISFNCKQKNNIKKMEYVFFMQILWENLKQSENNAKLRKKC